MSLTKYGFMIILFFKCSVTIQKYFKINASQLNKQIHFQGGKAALHLAAEFGHGEVVDILLKHKAFANARSKKGMTPLHLAARNGYTEIVQKLVSQYGATLDALTLVSYTRDKLMCAL